MGPGTKMPDWLEPMAATLTQDRFSGGDWLFEQKFDGIRLLAYKCGADIHLYSRNRLEQHLPPVAEALARLTVDEIILDGEITWGPQSGYHVFDILWLNGHNTTSLALEDRRALLKELPLSAPMRRVELIDDPEPWERARREGWEGVISQELVVGGFTDPQGTRVGLGALLVGFYEGPDFVFAGKIGTGFDTKLLTDLRRRLDAIEIPKAPFTKATGLPRLRAHWVRPEIVVEAAFIEWTGNDKLRHPRLINVHFDKPASDVVRASRALDTRG